MADSTTLARPLGFPVVTSSPAAQQEKSISGVVPGVIAGAVALLVTASVLGWMHYRRVKRRRAAQNRVSRRQKSFVAGAGDGGGEMSERRGTRYDGGRSTSVDHGDIDRERRRTRSGGGGGDGGGRGMSMVGGDRRRGSRLHSPTQSESEMYSPRLQGYGHGHSRRGTAAYETEDEYSRRAAQSHHAPSERRDRSSSRPETYDRDRRATYNTDHYRHSSRSRGDRDRDRDERRQTREAMHIPMPAPAHVHVSIDDPLTPEQSYGSLLSPARIIPMPDTPSTTSADRERRKSKRKTAASSSLRPSTAPATALGPSSSSRRSRAAGLDEENFPDLNSSERPMSYTRPGSFTGIERWINTVADAAPWPPEPPRTIDGDGETETDAYSETTHAETVATKGDTDNDETRASRVRPVQAQRVYLPAQKTTLSTASSIIGLNRSSQAGSLPGTPGLRTTFSNSALSATAAAGSTTATQSAAIRDYFAAAATEPTLALNPFSSPPTSAHNSPQPKASPSLALPRSAAASFHVLSPPAGAAPPLPSSPQLSLSSIPTITVPPPANRRLSIQRRTSRPLSSSYRADEIADTLRDREHAHQPKPLTPPMEEEAKRHSVSTDDGAGGSETGAETDTSLSVMGDPSVWPQPPPSVMSAGSAREMREAMDELGAWNPGAVETTTTTQKIRPLSLGLGPPGWEGMGLDDGVPKIGAKSQSMGRRESQAESMTSTPRMSLSYGVGNQPPNFSSQIPLVSPRSAIQPAPISPRPAARKAKKDFAAEDSDDDAVKTQKSNSQPGTARQAHFNFSSPHSSDSTLPSLPTSPITPYSSSPRSASLLAEQWSPRSRAASLTAPTTPATSVASPPAAPHRPRSSSKGAHDPRGANNAPRSPPAAVVAPIRQQTRDSSYRPRHSSARA